MKTIKILLPQYLKQITYAIYSYVNFTKSKSKFY